MCIRDRIENEDGTVICVQTQKTCVSTTLDIDFGTFDINEWTKSVSVEFGLEASAVVHRVALPQGYYDVNDDTTIRMDVIPSDLVRLMGDIMSRTDDPKVIKKCLDPDNKNISLCDEDRLIEFNLTSCLLYTSPSPRDATLSRMPSSA